MFRSLFIFAGIVILGAPGFAQPAAITLLDAARSALAHHPAIRIQEEQVRINRGVQQQASGAFDTTLTTGLLQNYSNTPLTGVDQAQNSSSAAALQNIAANVSDYNLSATKLYRNGISIDPVLSVTRTRDNLFSPQGVNTANLLFQVTVPLLRNRGRDVVAAQETSAARQVDASLLDLNQTIAELLANTVLAYWNYVAALKLFQVALGSEERGRIFLGNVQALIAGGRAPRSDINQVQANLAGRSSDRLAAEQQLESARQQFAVAIGLTAAQMPDVPEAADDFPAGTGTSLPALEAGALRAVIEPSISRRADVLAARQRIEASRTLIPAVRNQTRPQLDITFGGGYNGLSEGRYPNSLVAAPFQGVRGPNAIGGVTYRFPPANNYAQGQLVQIEAATHQAELRAADLERNVASAIVVALNGVRNAHARLGRTAESVAAFRTALDAEREKFRFGASALIDVLTVEDRLTAALNSEVQAKLAFAQAIIQVRLATGTIVAPDRPVQDIARDALVKLPDGMGQ